jgi:predicted ATPase/DNA-binding CsgD family transcriptional regulator/transcriptional regulator with XRE-family HTH domain
MKTGDIVETKSFGEWLRHRRRDLDLTQEELARQVGCAPITVRKIEADQMRPSKQLAELLMGQVGVASEERESFMHFARGGEPAKSITTTEPHCNLPHPISSFIGRDREIGEVKRLMSSSRLVTLTGAGGSGKTRLAIEAARQMLDLYPDGVWFVAFAPLSDSTLVHQTIASTLMVREDPSRPLIESLGVHLHSKHLLLVFDNCEHLIAECAQAAHTLLQACPRLSILATSREALRIEGEEQYHVPSLSLPSRAEIPSPDQMGESEAVRLFVNRVTLVQPAFTLTAENSSPVAQICQSLDGMPLAIELAAARVRALSVQQVAERLDDRFHLLTGGSRTAPARQQTLAAALDWSYALLSEAERSVLLRLSIFAGGATLEAAEAICAGQGVNAGDVLDLLSRLTDKSLIVVDRPEDGWMRYRLLETIRQYAHEKLGQAGEVTETRNRHLNYFVQWAEKAEPYLDGGEQILWLQRFEMEHDNLRAALEWSQAAPDTGESGLRLAAASGSFWGLHDHISEGRMRLAAALAHKGAQGPTPARAIALHRASLLAFYQSDYLVTRAMAEESLDISGKQGTAGRLGVANAFEMLAEVASETGDYPSAFKLYEKALTLYRELGYLVYIGSTLKMVGWSAMRTGDYEQARLRLEEALVMCRQTGDPHQITSTLAGLGELATRTGQYERADELLEESLKICRKIGEKWNIAIALGSLGWVALRRHDFGKMRVLLRESLTIRRETGDRGGMAWCLEKLAEAASFEGEPEKVARLFGAASALRAPTGSVIDHADIPNHDRLVSELQTALGMEAAMAARAEGEAMPLDEMIPYALSEPESPPAESAHGENEKFGGLTARESEVAAWIARGKSNREIARNMTVGVKTVETYVTRILNKLGFDSRVQIATWMVEEGFDKRSEGGQS